MGSARADHACDWSLIILLRSYLIICLLISIVSSILIKSRLQSKSPLSSQSPRQFRPCNSLWRRYSMLQVHGEKSDYEVCESRYLYWKVRHDKSRMVNIFTIIPSYNVYLWNQLTFKIKYPKAKCISPTIKIAFWVYYFKYTSPMENGIYTLVVWYFLLHQPILYIIRFK